MSVLNECRASASTGAELQATVVQLDNQPPGMFQALNSDVLEIILRKMAAVNGPGPIPTDLLLVCKCFRTSLLGLASTLRLVRPPTAVLAGQPRLRKLMADGHLNDATLTHLRPLTTLRHIDLGGCSRVTGSGFSHLSSLHALTRLDVSSVETPESILVTSLLRAYPRLSSDLQPTCKRAAITDAGLDALATLTSLRCVTLRHCDRVSGAAVSKLTRLTALQRLELGRGQLNNTLAAAAAGVAPLAALPTLQHLRLSRWCDADDNCAALLAQISSLCSLALAPCFELTGAGLAHLASLAALTRLDIVDCYGLSDAHLSHLLRLTALQHLSLQACHHIFGDGLHAVAALPALRGLSLTSCPVTDAHLQHLSRCPALTELDLSFCRGVEGLGALLPPALARLRLTGCINVRDGGLAALPGLPALQSLDLRNCRSLTDACLDHLARTTALRELNLVFTRFSPAAVAQLSAAAPRICVTR